MSFFVQTFDNIVTRTLTGGSTDVFGNRVELESPSERFAGCWVTVNITSPSSLVGGFLIAEALANNTTGALAWTNVPQHVSVLASGGGTPQVIDGNTAAATAATGGLALNASGVTNITNTITATFYVPAIGSRLAIEYGATSGTATVQVSAKGLLAVGG